MIYALYRRYLDVRNETDEPLDVELPAIPRGAELRALRPPVMLLAGERDEYCPPEALRTMGTEFRRARVEILEGTDHYLWRREREAATLIGEFVDEVVPGAPG